MKYSLVCMVILLANPSTRADEGDSAPQEFAALARVVHLAQTTSLPEVDRIEICTLVSLEGDVPQDDSKSFLVKPGTRSGIHSSMTIDGKDSDRIADDWRGLRFRPNGAFCHLPAYGLRFYRHEELILSVSVCWKCHNFYMPVIDPKTGRASMLLYGFDEHASSKRLLNHLRRLLPPPKKHR